jgi:hypothetical protein
MDMLFGIIGFALGYAIAKNSKSDPTKIESHLYEENKRLIEDLAYYKKLCKSIAEENVELRRTQK